MLLVLCCGDGMAIKRNTTGVLWTTDGEKKETWRRFFDSGRKDRKGSTAVTCQFGSDPISRKESFCFLLLTSTSTSVSEFVWRWWEMAWLALHSWWLKQERSK